MRQRGTSLGPKGRAIDICANRLLLFVSASASSLKDICPADKSRENPRTMGLGYGKRQPHPMFARFTLSMNRFLATPKDGQLQHHLQSNTVRFDTPSVLSGCRHPAWFVCTACQCRSIELALGTNDELSHSRLRAELCGQLRLRILYWRSHPEYEQQYHHLCRVKGLDLAKAGLYVVVCTLSSTSTLPKSMTNHPH